MRALPFPEKPWFLAVAASSLIAGILLVSTFLHSADRSLLCFSSTSTAADDSDLTAAILHYATSAVTPQQSFSEISISYRVLRSRSPCNFLVFGLGHDSLMWHSFNRLGSTLFLEEDPKWIRSVLRSALNLKAHGVTYPTQLVQADRLLKTWRSEKACLPDHAKVVKGDRRCKLSLADLPEEVYDKEWDTIMIDAPRGYFNEAPGRMGAIYTAAVMARNRKGAGSTDVFLHDVDRRVEKMYAMEFLCKKYLVEGTGRLWHFRIPPARPKGNETRSNGGFC